MQGRQYTWSAGETLREMHSRADEIKEKHAVAMARAASRRTNLPLIDVLDDVLAEDGGDDACMVCHL